jgi:Eco57I restriction-modification methylase/MmeI, target recognition domain
MLPWAISLIQKIAQANVFGKYIIPIKGEGVLPAAKPVVPLHWPLEFPEVFDRDNPGFDAVVGNPPFAGKNTTIAVNAEHYLDWLQTLHVGAHGNSDVLAHFFRRAYGLLRDGGCLGLLATNTIRQGDTRATGLRPIRQAGGTIYTARRRYKWPGEAAVVVSVVHIAKGDLAGPYRLDGREAPVITAFLFHDGGDDDPKALHSNLGTAFEGVHVLGMGFTFDDTDKKGVVNPIGLMTELIEKNPRNKERIFPFIGGEEINESPMLAYHRYIINFEDFPRARDLQLPSWQECDERQRREMLRNGVVSADYPDRVAADWPDLLRIAEERVQPERQKQKDRYGQDFWWRLLRHRPEMHEAIRRFELVLAISKITHHMSFAFLASNIVFSKRLAVFASDSAGLFASLQSRLHEVWARFFGATLEDRLSYTPSDVFDNFPLPLTPEAVRLKSIGQEYHDFRAAMMIEREEGMTDTYNRFHDPDERSNAFGELRRLHDAMDRAVLDAYGWTDIRPTCEFELEWEDDEAESGRSRRKKPWRYRWPEPVRDEVLARLLALNAQRAEEERRAEE